LSTPFVPFQGPSLANPGCDDDDDDDDENPPAHVHPCCPVSTMDHTPPGIRLGYQD
jgi:hypothetical protein